MIKLVSTQSLSFENKEELIDKLIRFVYEYDSEGAPLDYENPESWTDEAIQQFLKEKGGSFLYDQVDRELENWIDDSQKSKANYELVEEY